MGKLGIRIVKIRIVKFSGAVQVAQVLGVVQVAQKKRLAIGICGRRRIDIHHTTYII